MARKKPVKEKTMFTGKRRRAVARARFTPGKGVVKINSVPLEHFSNEIIRMRMQEPLILAGDEWKKHDIHVNVSGGGVMGQGEAARQAIAKGIIHFIPGKKEEFLKYDRFMVVYDPRRTEPHKPPRSSQGPRRAKQKSKR